MNAGQPERRRTWRHRRGILSLARPAIMGVVNVTPDSFSDGGEFLRTDRAVAHALRLAADGADIIDIGGESTRPGANTVSVEQELRRVVPVFEALRDATDAALSIDTTKAEVARACADAGADIVNDVSGLTFEPALASIVAEYQLGLCVMHTTGRPDVMQHRLVEEDIVGEVRMSLARSVEEARAAGIDDAYLAIDPGFGFGKSVAQNYALIGRLPDVHVGDLPVLVGLSRKSMIRNVVGESAEAIEHGTTAANTLLFANGAGIVRTHDVAAAVAARAVWRQTFGQSSERTGN